MNDELKHLEFTIKKMDEIINDSKLKLSRLKELYKTNYEAMLLEKTNLEHEIQMIEKSKLVPYFARIDFQGKTNKDICYIGTKGIHDYDNNIIIVDWRAPISSLYYDSNIGYSQYKVENEVIEGNLLLKRQYKIENQVLLSFADVDIVSNDELLKPFLSVSVDARLKNIVSTIQKEQNEIIRSDIYSNLIIQGVAGSGKTTVALHRIAYLVYNYRDLIENNQYMVIGPNKFFINYISSVLPDLDVNGVKQYDLIEFTCDYLKESIIVENGYTSLSKKKTTIDFLQILDSYMDDYLISGLPKDDLKIKNFSLLSNSEIKEVWYELNNRNYEVMFDKIQRIILLLEKHLLENHQKIILNIDEYYDKELTDGKNLGIIRKERANILKELKKGYRPILKKYFSRILKKSTEIYQEFLDKMVDKNDTKKIYYEDLPSLLYINYRMYGSMEYENIKHAVIDEAQDYNELTFYVLKKIMRKSTFSIYGDIAQSLYPSHSFDTWDNVITKSFGGHIDIKYLSKSYRTSIEIMNEANKINRHLKLYEAEAVIRHADNVIYQKIKNKEYDIKYYIDLFIKKKLKSIAIITKTQYEGNIIYEKLKKEVDISVINDDNQEYNGGICIITSRLSKGLEFDAVIISDANEQNYVSDNDLDMKLLYVSMTRAMHSLVILYNDELCAVLR